MRLAHRGRSKRQTESLEASGNAMTVQKQKLETREPSRRVQSEKEGPRRPALTSDVGSGASSYLDVLQAARRIRRMPQSLHT